MVDLDERTILRTMAATAPLADVLDAGFSQLGRDGEPLELLMRESCKNSTVEKLSSSGQTAWFGGSSPTCST